MMCSNTSCLWVYEPHTHEGSSIDTPKVSVGWPERMRWRMPTIETWHGLVKYGTTNTHSGLQLGWKVDCDRLGHDDWVAIAKVITHKFTFSQVHGVPRGGLRLAAALQPYCVPGYPGLVVDDVMTTGASMDSARFDMRAKMMDEDFPVVGVVVFSRGRELDWVWPLFRVADWAQARGTGIG